MESPSKQQKIDNNSSQIPLMIWLDSFADASDENRNAQELLRAVDPNLKLFKLPNECEDFIKSNSGTNQIVLIVSGGLGQTFVPLIRTEKQVVSIYVYCGNEQHHKKWAKNYPEIRLVTTKLFELIEAMKTNDFNQTKPIIEEPIEENEISGAGAAGIYEFNSRHIIADLSLHYLLNMKREKTDKDDFILLCQTKIGQDSSRQAILQQFQETDPSDRILLWFNRDPLFNRVLLKAFQYLNIENMYACRYLIQNIQKYFDEHKHTSLVHTYRCTIMSSELLRDLKACEGKIIGIKSLWTTTCDRSMALYCNPEQDIQKRVLFEIDADPQINGVKPFVKTSPSYDSSLQDAVVFTIGSLFKINGILEEDNGTTIIQMALCADESTDLLKTKLINNNQQKDFIGFIQLLYNLSKDLQNPDVLDNADQILENYLKNSSSNDNDRIRACDLLGNIFDMKNQLDKSLVSYKEALNLKEKILSPNDPNRIDSYYKIACIYSNKKDYDQALNTFKQALNISKQIHGEDSLSLIQWYIKISEIYEIQEKFTDLLICHNQMLNIMLKNFPTDDQQLAFLYNNIGKTYVHLEEYSLALGYYTRSLELKLKYQFPKEYIVGSYKSIGIVHRTMGNMDQARIYFEKAIETYNQLEIVDQNSIIEIQQLIENLSNSSM